MSVKSQMSCVNTTALTLMGITTAPATKAMFLKKTTPCSCAGKLQTTNCI